MTKSIIAIKGNHLDKQSEIFEAFKYIDLDQDRQFDKLEEMYAYLSDNYLSFSERDLALLGIWIENDWTIICDPEMVNALDVEALSKLSEKLNSDVLTFLIQTTSASFGFAKYNLAVNRNFLSINEKITDNVGSQLPEEVGLNINEQIFVDDITDLARRFGIDFEKSAKQIYIAKHLGYNEALKKELQDFKSTQLSSATKTRPWWKVW